LSLGQQFYALARNAHWRRLLLIAVILPFLIVFLTEALLRQAILRKWDVVSGSMVYALLVGQMALLSLAVGKLILNWSWRLVIFGWALTLVHLTLVRATATEGGYVGRNPTILLTLAFVSAELGAISIWGVLGTLPWPARLPAAIMLGTAVVSVFPWPWRGYAEPWLSALNVQVFALLALSTTLRLAGYELRHVDDSESVFPGARQQFTIAHLFIWTTVIAALLGLFRLVGPPMLRIRGEWLPPLMLGGCFAIAGLAAFCATLGKGHWSVRLAAFVCIGLGVGWAAHWIAEFAGRPRNARLGSQWMLWTCLAQSFLAALLLLWNATGYRLMRTGNPLGRWLRG
jgi:hypothetical protein